MTKNISKTYFKKLDKILDMFFISLLDDISVNHNINKDDLIKHYPESYQKKIEKENKKNNN